MRNGENVMKNAKYGVLFGIALVLIMLFAACDNPFEAPDINAQLPDGYGTVSINLTGEAVQESERTVLPSTVFDKYVYTFTKAGSTTGTPLEPINEHFRLEAGSYTVEVQAFIGTAEPYTLAATGTSTQFNVSSGSTTIIRVTLSCETSGGQGKFSYAITYPSDSTAEITLKKWPGGEGVTLNPVSVSVGNGITQTLNLDVGSYMLTVLVSKDGLIAGKNEAVRIYPVITTEYTKNFTDEDMLVGIPPTVNATGTVLTLNTWEDGSLTSSGEQWYKFTATSATQYIHTIFDTLDSSSGIYVQVYDSSGVTVGNQTRLYGSTRYASRSVGSGQVYYIRVTPYNSSNTGTYHIAFSASGIPPSNTKETAIPLTAEIWENGGISSSGEQWYKFTATADTQYIYAGFGTLNSSYGFYVQVYDSSDGTVGSQARLYSSTTSVSQTGKRTI